MLMLQRAAENVNPSECNDPAVLLACSLGSDSCPAACVNKSNTENEEEEGNTPSNISDMPVAGDLTIAVADYSSSVKSAPAVGTVVFNAVDFKASEKITIESIKLERTGLSSKSDIKGVWFEKGGVAVSSKASLSSDGTATTRFYNNYSVNGTDTLDLVVELSGAAGSEIAFKLIDSVTTAKNVSLNTETTTYRTTNYNVATLTFEVNGGTGSVSYKLWESQTYEIGKFSVQNSSSSENKDVVIKSIKFRNEGAADLAATLKNVYVTRDGKTVSKNVELSTREMTIYFDDNQLDSGKKAIYTIFAETASLDRVGDNVKLQLRKSSEFVANEKSTNFRVKINDEVGTRWTLKNYVFNGWKINLTTASNYAKTVDAAPSSSDVEIAKGTLTVAEAVRFENWISIAVKSVSDGSDVTSIIDQMKVEIGGSTYTLDHKWTNATGTYETTEDIYVSKTSDVRVLVSLKAVTENSQRVVFDNIRAANLRDWRYESNDQSVSTDIAGTIEVADLSVKAGKFNLTNKSSSTQKVVKNTSSVVTIFDWEITTKDSKVSVTDLILSWVFSKDLVDDKNQISLTVYVNGEAYSDTVFKKSSNWEVRFYNLGDVVSWTPMKVKITAQPNIIDLTGSVTFGVSAEWTDANGNPVRASKVNAAKLEITNAASATIANSTASSTVVKDGSNSELLTFTTTVKDWSYNLTSLAVALKSASKVLSGESISLEIDGSSVESTTYQGTWANSWAITFGSLNETLEVGKHTFVLKSNLNTISSNNAEDNKIAINKVTLNGDNTTAKTLNITKLVAKAYPTISAETQGDDLILTINNPSSNDDDISVSGFVVTGTWVAASLNEKVLTMSNGKPLFTGGLESIAPGDSIKFRIQAEQGSTVQVTAINIEVDTKALTINSDYTYVGTWSSFKVTAKK